MQLRSRMKITTRFIHRNWPQIYTSVSCLCSQNIGIDNHFFKYVCPLREYYFKNIERFCCFGRCFFPVHLVSIPHFPSRTNIVLYYLSLGVVTETAHVSPYGAAVGWGESSNNHRHPKGHKTNLSPGNPWFPRCTKILHRLIQAHKQAFAHAQKEPINQSLTKPHETIYRYPFMRVLYFTCCVQVLRSDPHRSYPSAPLTLTYWKSGEILKERVSYTCWAIEWDKV